MDKIKVKIECGECGEKYFLYLSCEKVQIVKEIDMYLSFECTNCKEIIEYNYQQVE